MACPCTFADLDSFIQKCMKYCPVSDITSAIVKDFKGFIGGSVAEWLEHWTCDQQVAGSNPGLSAIECNPGQVVNTRVPLSTSSIIWYQPMGGDALRLGK